MDLGKVLDNPQVDVIGVVVVVVVDGELGLAGTVEKHTVECDSKRAHLDRKEPWISPSCDMLLECSPAVHTP